MFTGTFNGIDFSNQNHLQGIRLQVALASDGEQVERGIYHDEAEYLHDFAHARGLRFCERCNKVVSDHHYH